MSMKVERSTVEQVRERFEMHKRKAQEKKEVREYGTVAQTVNWHTAYSMPYVHRHRGNGFCKKGRGMECVCLDTINSQSMSLYYLVPN